MEWFLKPALFKAPAGAATDRVVSGIQRICAKFFVERHDPDELTWIERIYLWLPKASVPYLLGSCRPVFMEGFVKDAGFNEIRRLFVSNITCSEIVTAKKPRE